jgi:hypothetical protein
MPSKPRCDRPNSGPGPTSRALTASRAHTQLWQLREELRTCGHALDRLITQIDRSLEAAVAEYDDALTGEHDRD